jgi:drug/metabolite transporter (DMT)-like permease
MENWLLLSAIALAFWGLSGITQKLSTLNVSFEASFLWFALTFLPISALIVITAPLSWNLSYQTVALAAVGGLLNGGGALTSFAALERGGKASVVIPLISLYPLITVSGAWLFLGERLSGRQIAGAILAVAAAFLLAQEPARQELAGAPGSGG